MSQIQRSFYIRELKRLGLYRNGQSTRTEALRVIWDQHKRHTLQEQTDIDLEADNAHLRSISAELLDALKDLNAWANMGASTNPTTIAVREKVQAVITMAERSA
jgi:hypothetical protein